MWKRVLVVAFAGAGGGAVEGWIRELKEPIITQTITRAFGINSERPFVDFQAPVYGYATTATTSGRRGCNINMKRKSRRLAALLVSAEKTDPVGSGDTNCASKRTAACNSSSSNATQTSRKKAAKRKSRSGNDESYRSIDSIATPKKKRSLKKDQSEVRTSSRCGDTVKDESSQSKSQSQAIPPATHSNLAATLPRTIETSIRLGTTLGGDTDVDVVRYPHIIGIDEAGRGPLAGPVVAAAVCFPEHATSVPGVVDSKKVSQESTREDLYEQIIATPGVAWAIAIIDSNTIDSINILQATLLGMKLAAESVIGTLKSTDCNVVDRASVTINGCYVVRGRSSPLLFTAASRNAAQEENDNGAFATNSTTGNVPLPLPPMGLLERSESFYALIDGNRLPADMPCRGETVVKGDGREYCIAAASILAKVTRDRLMNDYDVLYPVYGLRQHKGYPTAKHRQAVLQYGASPIHRRTFAPLKHMRFDSITGQILIEND